MAGVRGKDTSVRNLPSWMGLGVVITLSILVLLVAKEEAITGHAAIQNIAFVRGGSELYLEVRDVPGIIGMTVFFSQDSKNNAITVEQNMQIPFEGNFYSKFTISAKDPASIGRIDLSLKVLEQELLQRGIAQRDLLAYVDGSELSTSYLRRDDRYYYYTTQTTVLGDFVLGKLPQENVPPLIGVVEESQEPVQEPLQENQAGMAQEPPEQSEEPVIEQEIPEPEEVPVMEPQEEQPAVPQLTFWQKIVGFFKALFRR